MNAEKFKVETHMLAVMLLAMVIAGRAGYYVFQQHTKHQKEIGQREMFTIANLKAYQIARN